MDFNAVIDISSIIWDTNDYNINRHKYYEVKNELLSLLTVLGNKRAKLFMREELCLQMIDEFPFNTMPDDFRDFGTQVYYHLSGIGDNLQSYPPNNNLSRKSVPDLVRPYFSSAIKTEIRYLITSIHTPPKSQITYFTFEHFWGGNETLTTLENAESLPHRTIVCKKTAAEDLFELLRRKFDPSDKHHSGRKSGGYVSPLTCYKDEDVTVPQNYLDLAMKEGSNYYYFDTENDVYVVFRPTRVELNTYHAHDEGNFNAVPPAVRKHFNR